MTVIELIEHLLASLPDDELPEPDRVEESSDGTTVVWFRSHGRCLGSAHTVTDGVKRRDPSNYRRGGVQDALEAERICRMDQAHLTETES